MAYKKVGWKDYPDTTTPVNATNLNQMDEGIAAVDQELTTQKENATDMQDTIDQLNTGLSELNIKMDSAEKSIATKQDASTAITTSNIGDQSVNYANSSNHANSAGSASAATKAYQDGNGANIASTYLKGTQNNGDFINRPSVNIDGNICGLIPTYKQNSQGYPVVGLYIQPGTERLIVDWYADGNIIKSYITTGRV